MITAIVCIAIVLFIVVVVGMLSTGPYDPYDDFIRPDDCMFEHVKLDKQKALAGNSMNYLFDQQVAPKNKECKIPLPAPVGRKFREKE
jgi:hypothetical protein